MQQIFNNSISFHRRKICSKKLVLLGTAGVGKSSLVVQFVREHFCENQEPTIGATYFQKSVNINNCIVNFDIWDTAGQERYHSLVPLYYRNADAALVVYDATSLESFNKAKKWVEELRMYNTNPDIIIMLVCNKIDLIDENKLDTKKAKLYAQENNLLFIETSAKTNYNVNELFKTVAENVSKIIKNPIDPETLIVKKEDKKILCCYKF